MFLCLNEFVCFWTLWTFWRYSFLPFQQNASRSLRPTIFESPLTTLHLITSKGLHRQPNLGLEGLQTHIIREKRSEKAEMWPKYLDLNEEECLAILRKLGKAGSSLLWTTSTSWSPSLYWPAPWLVTFENPWHLLRIWFFPFMLCKNVTRGSVVVRST